MEQEPTYHLEGVIRSKEEMEDFEGPLALILMLLSENKIEIRDIQVSEILDDMQENAEHLAGAVQTLKTLLEGVEL